MSSPSLRPAYWLKERCQQMSFDVLTRRKEKDSIPGKYSFIKANNDVWNSRTEFPRSSIIANQYKRFTNCSNALTFRLSADDTDVFALARDVKVFEKTVNSELKKVKIWCDVNRLSINYFSKTNFMIIKCPQKKMTK